MVNDRHSKGKWAIISLVGGLEHYFYFSIYWECHHPNWQAHIFQRGRLNHQPACLVYDDYKYNL